MAKVICVLYDDPVDGYPKSYARDGLPKLEHYPDGQSLPTPKAIDAFNKLQVKKIGLFHVTC